MGIIHLILHFLIPAVVCGAFYRSNWTKAYLMMLAAMLIDLDHLMADPIYDPCRCSIGTHLLHGFLPIAFYVLLCVSPRTRIFGIGLMIHVALDGLDCRLTNGVWFT